VIQMQHRKPCGTTILLAIVLALVFMALGFTAISPVRAYAEDTSDASVWRLYNPNSGEHFYTISTGERDILASDGWLLEGVGWVAPASSSTPVYRLYNPNAGDHHYTVDWNEMKHLVSVGWSYEGIGWYSDDAHTVAVYRQYNPNAVAGAHNFTTSQGENDYLASIGWHAEGVGWYEKAVGNTYTAGSNIMGVSRTSVKQMVAWYNSENKTYPTGALSKGGAKSITDFAEIVYEEATAEGVRPEVVFCQAMLETGWLQFGGQVSISQYNFAGLGVLDGGAAGASFADVRMGIRAQVQHLKLYASTEALNNLCVDPRWNAAVQKYGRGSAPNVEKLSGRWASSTSYGADLLSLINELIAF
jgi:hypothetical protein